MLLRLNYFSLEKGSGMSSSCCQIHIGKPPVTACHPVLSSPKTMMQKRRCGKFWVDYNV